MEEIITVMVAHLLSCNFGKSLSVSQRMAKTKRACKSGRELKKEKKKKQ